MLRDDISLGDVLNWAELFSYIPGSTVSLVNTNDNTPIVVGLKNIE